MINDSDQILGTNKKYELPCYQKYQFKSYRQNIQKSSNLFAFLILGFIDVCERKVMQWSCTTYFKW